MHAALGAALPATAPMHTGSLSPGWSALHSLSVPARVCRKRPLQGEAHVCGSSVGGAEDGARSPRPPQGEARVRVGSVCAAAGDHASRSAQSWSLDEIAAECDEALDEPSSPSISSSAVRTFAHTALASGHFAGGLSEAPSISAPSLAPSADPSAAIEGSSLFEHAVHADTQDASRSAPTASGGMLPRVPLVRTRSCHQRVGWSAREDGLVLDGVRQHGKRWRVIAAALPGRTQAAVRNRWSRLPKNGATEEPNNLPMPEEDERSQWSSGEDAIILSSVPAHGHKWRWIASKLRGRSEQAVRNRYCRLMRAQGLDAQGSWTKEEDACIMASVSEFGNKWTVISARCLPSRSEDAIRNRYTRLKRAQEATPHPRPESACFRADLA